MERSGSPEPDRRRGPWASGRVDVERAHALGLGVLPWTVNEPDGLLRVVAAGVDGLVTDHPDRALRLLRGS